MKQKNAIALHGHVALPSWSNSTARGISSPSKMVVGLNMEMATFGYTLSPEAGLALSCFEGSTFQDIRLCILTGLAEVTGSEENFNVLFAGFPHSTPDQREYMRARVRGHMHRTGGFASACEHMIVPYHRIDVAFNSGGVVMLTDGSSFSTAEFGVDPVTQFALPGVVADDQAHLAHLRVAPLKVLGAASPTLITAWVDAYLSRGSSLSAQERELIEDVGGMVTPAKPVKVFRETLPLVYRFHADDAEYIRSLVASATDVLRIAAYMSDRKADLSLAEPVRFRITTGQRKRLLGLLDGLVRPEEDMLRHRERWLRLGERLNPGTEEHRQRYPVAARAFDMLRSDHRSIPSFNRVFEAGFNREATPESRQMALRAVSRRPGEAMRRMEWMLRGAGDEALEHIQAAVARANPRLLSKLSVYLKGRIETATSGVNTSVRAFPIKGASNRFKMIQDNRPALDIELASGVLAGIDREISTRLAALPPLGAVYLDPELKHRVIAVNRRGDSATSSRVDMGSAYPADEAPVLRLFGWWKGNFDVDLSVNLYDGDWDLLQSVGYYNLHDRDRVFVHSGDIQNAPEGAAEFVDIDKAAMDGRYPTARYAVMSLISFRGDGFNTFPAFCGFMGRDALRSGKRFEPSEVVLRFDLSAPATNIVAAAWDIRENRMIAVDTVLNSHGFTNARGTADLIGSTARHVVEMRERGMNLYDVALRHTLARGRLVDTPEEADLVLDTRSFDSEQAEAWLDQAVPLPSSDADLDDVAEMSPLPRP